MEIIQGAFQREKDPEPNDKQQLVEKLLLMFRGLTFFSLDEADLRRRNNRAGKPVWYRSKTRVWVAIAALIALLTLIYLIAVGSSSGTVKSTAVSLNRRNTFSYTLGDHVHMVAFVHFYMEEVVPKVQKFQDSRWDSVSDDRPRLKDYQSGKRPEDIYNPAQLDFIGSYLCNSTRMYYHEEEQALGVNKTEYHVDRNFDFGCKGLSWADDEYRITYQIGMRGEAALGRILDSRIVNHSQGREAEL